MKIAVTSRGPGLEFPVDESFGRAYWIMLLDTESEDVDALDNSEIRNVLQGAGEKVSQWLGDLGVEIVITGKAGPKAMRQLQEHKITIFDGANGTVAEAIDDWKNGRLNPATAATCEGSPFCLVSRSYNPAWVSHKVELRLVKNS